MRFIVYEVNFDFRSPANPPGTFESKRTTFTVPTFASDIQIKERARKVALSCAKKNGGLSAVVTDIKRVKTTG